MHNDLDFQTEECCRHHRDATNYWSHDPDDLDFKDALYRVQLGQADEGEDEGGRER